MIQKNKILIKRLIKNGIITLVTFVVLGTGAFFLSGYDDTTQNNKEEKTTANNTITSEYNSIKTMISSELELSQIFQIYAGNHNSDFTLNRENITDILAKMREKYHLVNMEIVIAPISDVTSSGLTLKTGIMTKSDVTITCQALTDLSVYEFMEALQRQLPGLVLIRQVKFNRTGDIARNVLVDLSRHTLDPLVKAEVSFTWLGIRPDTKSGSENAK